MAMSTMMSASKISVSHISLSDRKVIPAVRPRLNLSRFKSVTCAAHDESKKQQRTVLQDLFLPIVTSAIIAGLAFSPVKPQEALAATMSRIEGIQTLSLLADAEIDTEEVEAPADPALVRAQKLKELLAQKRIEAEEKLAAAKAESEAIAKANAAKIEAEALAQANAAKSEAEAAAKSNAAKAAIVSAPETKDLSTPPPSVKASSSATAVAPVSKKTHGVLPLALAQLLVLAGYAGIASAVIFVPESVWESASETTNSLAAAAAPKIDEALKTAKPTIEKGLETIKKLAADSQPYVTKAVEAAKPVALEAIEKAKPVLKKGQEKAADLLAEAQVKVKNSLNGENNS